MRVVHLSHDMEDAVLEPEPHRRLDGEALDHALTVAADFIDLKSPYMGGHGRRCAELSSHAARRLGLSDDAVSTMRRAALVHDFGTTGVSNSILGKRGPLAALNPVASAHHEKCDGSGYHKRVRADAGDLGACVLAATEVYVGMTTDRADRPAFGAEDAAAELRRLVSQGVLEPRASRTPW